MSIVCVLEAAVAAFIAWKAFVACLRMTGETHHGIRTGWVIAGGAASWWALAVLAGDPTRAPLVATLIGFGIVALFDRRGGRHA